MRFHHPSLTTFERFLDVFVLFLGKRLVNCQASVSATFDLRSLPFNLQMKELPFIF